jgi:hypothetical protein
MVELVAKDPVEELDLRISELREWRNDRYLR